MNRPEYLINLAMEECAEIIKDLAKANRFGLDSVNPEDGTAPRERIALEVADLVAVLELMAEAGLIAAKIDTDKLVEAKKAKIEKYMKYSRAQGCLTD